MVAMLSSKSRVWVRERRTGKTVLRRQFCSCFVSAKVEEMKKARRVFFEMRGVEVRPWQREVVAAGERETRGAFWTRWAALFWRGGGRGGFKKYICMTNRGKGSDLRAHKRCSACAEFI